MFGNVVEFIINKKLQSFEESLEDKADWIVL